MLDVEIKKGNSIASVHVAQMAVWMDKKGIIHTLCQKNHIY